MTVKKKRNNNILPAGWRVWRPILGRCYLQWLEHRLLSQISWVKCQQQHFFAMFPWAPGLIALGLSLSLCCVGLERLPNRGELNEISHSMVQQIFPDCLLDARHCFKHREEVILQQASFLGMLQALNKCQLWSAHTPAFAETHTVVVGVRGHRCGWTLSLFGGSCSDEHKEFRLRSLMPCPDGFGI